MSYPNNPQGVWSDSGNPGNEMSSANNERRLPGDWVTVMSPSRNAGSDDKMEMDDVHFNGWASENRSTTPTLQPQASHSSAPETVRQSPSLNPRVSVVGHSCNIWA